MRTRISDELQIDATTYATEIDRAIYSAIDFYNDRDFWFLDTSATTFMVSATSRYSLATILPGRSQIKNVLLHLTPTRQLMVNRTPQEMLELDFDEDYTGEPLYWCIDNNQLHILPRAQTTRTAEVYFTLRNSMTACASASSVWTTEAEELIRLTAEADILENRIKDFSEAGRKRAAAGVVLENLGNKTVVRRGTRRIKPFM